MLTEIVEKLVDNSLTLGLLGIGLYFMWKENSAYRKKQDAELIEVKQEMHKYYIEDKARLEDIVMNCSNALENNTRTNKKTNELLQCLVPELVEFKKSESFRDYKQKKTA